MYFLPTWELEIQQQTEKQSLKTSSRHRATLALIWSHVSGHQMKSNIYPPFALFWLFSGYNYYFLHKLIRLSFGAQQVEYIRLSERFYQKQLPYCC